MKVLRLLFATMALASVGSAQTAATTEDGRKVRLFVDGTWEYLEGEEAKQPLISSPHGPYAVRYAPEKWSLGAEMPGEQRLLGHAGGKGGALFVSDSAPVAMEVLADLALAGVKNTDPEATLLSQESITLNGVEMMKLDIAATVNGLPFIYRGYHFGGKQGNAALTAFAVESEFSALEDDIHELLNGFEVGDEALHADESFSQSVIELNGGAATFSIDPAEWRRTSAADERHEFRRVDGASGAILIAEGVGMPVERLVEIAIANAKGADPETTIIEQEQIDVDGTPAVRMTMLAKPSGVEVIYHSLYITDDNGSYQVICYAASAIFEENVAAFEDFHAGFHLTAAGD